MKKVKIIFNKAKRLVFTLFCFFYTKNKNVFNCKINGWCKFNGNEHFKENVNFNGCKIYGKGNVTFGNNFHSGKGLTILTSIHNYNGKKIPYDETLIHKNVKIEDNVWVGMNVTILGGMTISEGAIIQAGSVISSNIPSMGIAGGNPAKVFKYRDKTHYYSLVRKDAYH